MIDLKRFREEKKISQSEICDILGIAQPYLSAIENGKRPLNKKKIDLLYKQFGDEILKYKQPDIILEKHSANEDIDNLTYVLLLPISAQGGTLDEFVVSVKDGDCEQIISPIKGADFAISVSGSSMEPEYPSGSKILIKKINEESFIEWGRCYVLDTCNGIVVKKLAAPIEEDPKYGRDYVTCVSVNPDPIYAPFNVPKKDIFGIYRVLMQLVEK